jgi:ribonucleotide reductase alpha subunit
MECIKDNIININNTQKHTTMNVLHRNGNLENVSFDRIRDHIEQLSKFPYKLNDLVNPIEVSKKVCNEIIDGITTQELNNHAAKVSDSKTYLHPDYSVLAARITVANFHKNTTESFYETIVLLYNYVNLKTNKASPLIDQEVMSMVKKYHVIIQEAIDYTRDYSFNYLGIKTLQKSYLLKINNEIVERPQHMFMRVALGIHRDSIEDAIDTYNLLSEGYIMHATPTLFNSGIPNGSYASCYLIELKDDSIQGIFDTLSTCAIISKNAGGIGINVHKMRGEGSYIAGTNGTSNGIVPFLKIFNQTAVTVDQGGGKRKGSFAIYLEPHHSDIEKFLELKLQTGAEELRAIDLFYALWVSDLFMERVANNENWSLFSPDEVPGLSDVHSNEYRKLYEKYESEGKARKVIKAVDLYKKIIDVQISTGTPYMLYKDSINRKSNQQNLGTITSSNLCAEIVEYTAPDEIAVCTLCTVGLSKFVKNGEFDYNLLYTVVRKITRNLNKIIDITHYPIPEAKLSNLRHRPLGIGVQGLADVFAQLKLPYTSDKAREINRNIFETMSFAFLTESCNLAKERTEQIKKLQELMNMVDNTNRDYAITGDIRNLIKKLYGNLYEYKYDHKYQSYYDEKIKNIMDNELSRIKYQGTYSSFEGSPLSKGKFQWDLWLEDNKNMSMDFSNVWDWTKLRKDIVEYGVRNSLGLSCQPTASSAQILGNMECFEPFTSNMYTRVVLSGQFQVVNKYLIEDLINIGKWNINVRNQLIADRGSIQNIDEIPQDIKDIYKTVWEISQKDIIQMSADRGRYICQSQSMNIHIAQPTIAKMSSMHLYAWKMGLKTGMYYLRSKPASNAQQFTVAVKQKELTAKEICSLDNPEGCLMCE